MTPNQVISKKRLEAADCIDRLVALDIVGKDAGQGVRHLITDLRTDDDLAALFALYEMLTQVRDYANAIESQKVSDEILRFQGNR